MIAWWGDQGPAPMASPPLAPLHTTLLRLGGRAGRWAPAAHLITAALLRGVIRVTATLIITPLRGLLLIGRQAIVFLLLRVRSLHLLLLLVRRCAVVYKVSHCCTITVANAG